MAAREIGAVLSYRGSSFLESFRSESWLPQIQTNEESLPCGGGSTYIRGELIRYRKLVFEKSSCILHVAAISHRRLTRQERKERQISRYRSPRNVGGYNFLIVTRDPSHTAWRRQHASRTHNRETICLANYENRLDESRFFARLPAINCVPSIPFRSQRN